jgi:4-hydroxybenzoate polyprenyltransferase/phosphoserine phosphatase
MDITTPARELSPDRPLVVDLDGTLIKSDLLAESFSTLMSTSPLRGSGTLGALRNGRAAFKAKLAEQVQMDLANLPLNPALMDYLRAERARGRRIYLASAAHESYVRAMADHLGLFDGIFASNTQTNLKGAAKSRVLCEAFGRFGFDYAGNSAADMDVWKDAGGVVVVNAPPALVRSVAARHPGAIVLDPRTASLSDYRQAMRVHQWVKNLLIFVPAFTAHLHDLRTVALCLVAFLSFSLSASSMYVLNDLLDLRSDRAHPTKRLRPFAAGALDAAEGLRLSLGCMLASLGLAMFLPWRFLVVLAAYCCLTSTYSTWLKRKANIDVLMLALLYGVRLVAGGAAVTIELSPWLLMFSLFFFLCLALVKRSTELIDRQQKGAGDPPGRSYRLSDLPVLQTMTITSGYVSVLVFVLYVNSPAVSALYGSPERLWAVPVILLYWISRIVIMTHRGQMHDDPVVFAMSDYVSLICAGMMACVVLVSL